jgi:transposase
MATVEFPQLIERGAGLDVHKDTVVGTIRGTGLIEETRTFGTFTCELELLIRWLKEAGITHVAMESTGVYWKPVYYVLEAISISSWSMRAISRMCRVTKRIKKILSG